MKFGVDPKIIFNWEVDLNMDIVCVNFPEKEIIFFRF